MNLVIAAPQHAFVVESEVDRYDAYVGAQIILSVRLFSSLEAPQGQLTEPVASERFDVTHLGGIDIYETSRDGYPYKVLEKRYALTAKHAGELIIPPASVRLQAVDPEQFAEQGANANSGASLPMAVGPTLSIAVAQAQTPIEQWLPASHLTLEERWSRPPQFMSPGDYVVRTVTTKIHGIQAPAIPVVRMKEPAGFTVHQDRPVLHTDYHRSGVVGTRVDRFLMLAGNPGTFTIDPAQLQWWDVDRQQLQTETLPATVIRVELANARTPRGSAHGSPVDGGGVYGTVVGGGATSWRWRDLVLICLATLMTSWVGWRVYGRADLRRAERSLRAACIRHEPHAARDGLLAVVRRRWPHVASTDLAAVANEVNRPEFFEAVETLGESLYSTSGRWDGAHLWLAYKRIRRPNGSKRATNRVEPGSFFRLQRS